VLRGHPRSSATLPFDRTHTTSYSNLIETMRIIVKYRPFDKVETNSTCYLLT